MGLRLRGTRGNKCTSRDELEAILELAAEAAHSSERVAAPVACWVAAKAGLRLEEALAEARALGEATPPELSDFHIDLLTCAADRRPGGRRDAGGLLGRFQLRLRKLCRSR